MTAGCATAGSASGEAISGGPAPGFAVAADPAAAGDSVLANAAPADPALLALPSLRTDIPGFAPQEIVIDGFGIVFALDAAGGEIVRWDAESRWARFGVGDQGGGRFPSLRALAIRGPDLFALDPADGALYRLGLDGRLRARITLAAGDLGRVDPVDFVVDKAGELWALDRAGGRVLRFGREGEFLADLSAGAAGTDRLASPTRLALDEQGSLYVLEPGRGQVRRFSRQGEPLPAWSYRTHPAETETASDLLVHGGEVVVVGRGWIRAFGPEGDLLAERRLPFAEVVPAAAVSAEGVLHVARPLAGEVARFRWKASRDDGASEDR